MSAASPATPSPTPNSPISCTRSATTFAASLSGSASADASITRPPASTDTSKPAASTRVRYTSRNDSRITSPEDASIPGDPNTRSESASIPTVTPSRKSSSPSASDPSSDVACVPTAA